MGHSRQVNRILHDEHVAVIGLLERFQAFLANGGQTAPDGDDMAAQRMLSEIAVAIESEITSHFTFEEEGLFPFLDDAGYGDLGESLCDDHKVILPMGEDLAKRARAATADGLSDAAWADFRRLGMEFAERLTAHANNEETGLLPVLELAIDEESDRRLASEYALTR